MCRDNVLHGEHMSPVHLRGQIVIQFDSCCRPAVWPPSALLGVVPKVVYKSTRLHQLLEMQVFRSQTIHNVEVIEELLLFLGQLSKVHGVDKVAECMLRG